MDFEPISDFPKYEISKKGTIRNIRRGTVVKQYTNYKLRAKTVQLYYTDKKYCTVLVRDLKSKQFGFTARAGWVVYFKSPSGMYQVLSNNGEFTTCENLDHKQNEFFLLKGYKDKDKDVLTTTSLKLFQKDMKQWTRGLKKELNIDYTKFHNHYTVVHFLFSKLSPSNPCEKVTTLEYHWIEQCYNAGLTFCKPQTCMTFGYDFSSHYPSILASKRLKIPIKPGREYKLTKLPKKRKNRKFGYYRVSITCQNKEFRKLFSFSPKHVYTNYSLDQAFKFKEKFDVKIELFLDGKANAYLYDEEDLVNSADIFGNWYKTLMNVKAKHPDNRLLKHLLSALWGHLCQFNRITRKSGEIDDFDVSLIPEDVKDYPDYGLLDTDVCDGKAIYTLLDMEQPYKYTIARIKPFLTAVSRNAIGEVALLGLPNVVRIHTDGVAFSQELEHNIEGLLPEKKTTGLIHWRNVNYYNRL